MFKLGGYKNNYMSVCPGGSGNYIMQPRHCLEKVVPQICLCEQGEVKIEKGKDHLKEQHQLY